MHGIVLVAQPEDIAAQTAKMERRANAGDKAKQAKIRDMKVRSHLNRSPLPIQQAHLASLPGRVMQATLKASDTDAED